MKEMAENVLVTRGLCKRFGTAMAVDHVDMRVERGQIYGLVGKNGAGKTTLMRMNYLPKLPDRRRDRAVQGVRIHVPSAGCRQRIGAVIETPSFYPF